MKILDKTEDGNLDEQEKIKKTSQETEWELKPQYVIIALVVFVTFCCHNDNGMGKLYVAVK